MSVISLLSKVPTDFNAEQAHTELLTFFSYVEVEAVELLRNRILKGRIDGNSLTSNCGCFVSALAIGNNSYYGELMVDAGFQDMYNSNGK
jgi:hypothetical protein